MKLIPLDRHFLEYILTGLRGGLSDEQKYDLEMQLQDRIDKDKKKVQRKYISIIPDTLNRFNTFKSNKMKKLAILIIFFSLTLACKSQTPEICCYSQTQIDSILDINTILQTENNQLLDLNSAISLQNNYLNNKVDSLLTEISFRYDADTILIMTDTAYYEFGGELRVKINLQGEYIKIFIFDSDTNRIYLTKRNNDLQMWVEHDTFTKYSGFMNLR